MTHTLFLVVITNGLTRDIQVYTKQLPDDDNINFHDDENNWIDTSGEVVLGVFVAGSAKNAISEASKKHDIYAGNLNAYEIVKT